MNLFSLSGLLLTLSTGFLCIILMQWGNTRLHRLWLTFNFIVGLWGMASFLIGKTVDPKITLLIVHIIYAPIGFIPVLNYHVVYELCGLKEKKMLIFAYAQ